MSVMQGMTASFKQQLLQQGQNFATDAFYIALYNAPAVLDYTTTAYGTASEVVAAGYTAGGELLTGVTTTTSGDTVYVNFDNAQWSGAISATCALIYNASQANASVAVLDFGSLKSSTTVFTVTMPPNTPTTALLRF